MYNLRVLTLSLTALCSIYLTYAASQMGCTRYQADSCMCRISSVPLHNTPSDKMTIFLLICLLPLVTGISIRQVSWNLHGLGYLSYSNIDGSNGAVTKSSVRKFQRDRCLVDDGIVGPATLGELTSLMMEVQRKVGSGADGLNGPTTRSRIMLWQSKIELGLDGMTGPATKFRMNIERHKDCTATPPPQVPTGGGCTRRDITGYRTNQAGSILSSNSRASFPVPIKTREVSGPSATGIYAPATKAGNQRVRAVEGVCRTPRGGSPARRLGQVRKRRQGQHQRRVDGERVCRTGFVHLQPRHHGCVRVAQLGDDVYECGALQRGPGQDGALQQGGRESTARIGATSSRGRGPFQKLLTMRARPVWEVLLFRHNY